MQGEIALPARAVRVPADARPQPNPPSHAAGAQGAFASRADIDPAAATLLRRVELFLAHQGLPITVPRIRLKYVFF